MWLTLIAVSCSPAGSLLLGGDTGGGPSTGTTGSSTVTSTVTGTTSATSTTSTGTSTGTTQTGTTSTGTTLPPAEDYRSGGPQSVLVQSGEYSVNGCDLTYLDVEPVGGAVGPVVALAHGFTRNKEAMQGWAEHLASWGFRVIAPTFCHSSFWDADHAQNAADLVALVAVLDPGPVVYAGYSAGGLSAWLAGGTDANALAVVGLDGVDSTELGLAAAPTVSVPVYGVVGESSACNANANSLAVYDAMPSATAIQVVEAGHCDFEVPVDWACELVCRPPHSVFTGEEIGATVIGLGTAAVLAGSKVAPQAADWWTPGGSWYDLLESEGRIRVP